MSLHQGIEIVEDVNLFPEIKAVLAIDSRSDFKLDYDINPIKIGTYKIAPWGEDNLLPNHLLAKAAKNDVLSANLHFNSNVCYGLGPRLVKAVRDEKGQRMYDAKGQMVTIPVDEGEEFDWFEANDIPLFLMQQLTDMNYFYNAFVELRPSRTKQHKIETIRHREAVFSRWGMMDRHGSINYHYYCADWDKTPGKDDIICSRVIDEFRAIEDLEIFSAARERMVYGVYMPSPGKPYYSRPEWYSIFSSGWYDHSVMVPELKKAILKNQLGVKYIIYISPKYFENICKQEGIDMNDRTAYQERVNQEKQKFNEFLAGQNNANKAIMALKELVPTASGTTEHKYIEIVPVQNDLKGGEYIDDTESTANIICYAMGVHAGLIGATPGKNNKLVGGTEARELYLMKQAMMKPLIDRSMRILSIIKKYNGWDKDIFIQLPEYVFTTLDQNKSGKEESTNTEI